MDSTTKRRFTRTEVSLDEPHFDEEATLLSAQPVVPLEEVKTRTRSKARLALALAIGGGLLIGLLAATLLYRYLGPNGPQVVETTAVTEQTAAVESENSDGGSTSGTDHISTKTDEVTSPPVASEENKPAPAPAKAEPEPAKPQPNRQSEAKPRPVIIVRDETELDEEEEMERQARRAERQEERRQQRRAAKEARRETRQRAQTSDDLLRIREIFEGSPRP